MQILFTKTNSLVSKIIRWFIKDKNISYKDVPGHVAIRFGGKESNWMIQSHGHGVEPTWWPYFQKKNQIVHAYEVKGLPEDALEKIVEEYVSEVVYSKYDFLAIAGFALGQIKRKLFGSKQLKNEAGTSDRLFCSELAYRMLKRLEEKTDKDIIEDLDAETVSPLTLLRAVQKSKYFKKISRTK